MLQIRLRRIFGVVFAGLKLARALKCKGAVVLSDEEAVAGEVEERHHDVAAPDARVSSDEEIVLS